MSDDVAWILALVAWVAFYIFLEWKFPCKCGRLVFPYFFPNHERAGVMLFYGLLFTGLTVGDIIVGAPWYVFLWMVPFSCWEWLRWYKHEKDKLTKAAKGLGRVFVNEHGVLKVATNER